MSTNTWEQHLSSRENPVIEGHWGETPWAFYGYDQVLPPELPIKTLRTGMCVPVCSLNPDNPQVMFTINMGRGGLEIPGGHREVLRGGVIESSYMAAVRERGEETGLHAETHRLILTVTPKPKMLRAQTFHPSPTCNFLVRIPPKIQASLPTQK